jgi:hypothetical protein
MDTTVKGQVDGVAAGTSYIQAAYSGYNYYWNGYSCLNSPVNGDGYATMNMCDSGVPDHLEVALDSYQYPICPKSGPTLKRIIAYDVVDAEGIPLSNIPVTEAYSGLSKNTCGNGQPSPTPCKTYSNEFADNQSVYCNNVGGSCGYAISILQYHWCPSLLAQVAIGTLYTVQVLNNSASLTVNGKKYAVPPDSGELPIGTDIYP